MSGNYHPKRRAPASGGRRKKRIAAFLILALILAAAGTVLWRQNHPGTILYRDRELEIVRSVPRCRLDPEAFRPESGGRISYEKNGGSAVFGIDVSHHQGKIDWEAVAGDGVRFAMIRLGFRGYATGELRADACLEENLKGARENGILVGAYFFSQAVTPQEAEEEADFALELLDGRPLDYPLAFDWERIKPGRNARTDGLPGETVTACAAAFTDRIRQGGYVPMLYMNPDLGYLTYDLGTLPELPFWLAHFEERPDFCYDFDLWQYSSEGHVEGIRGKVDLDLDLRPAK